MAKQCVSASSGPDGKHRNWFEGRRNHFIRQAVADFFGFINSFHQLYAEYLCCRNPAGSRGDIDLLGPETNEHRLKMWDRLSRMIGSETDKGQLWELKDICHLIWPEHDRRHNVHGALVDWLLGSVFHEAMKLKENIYLVNTYGPAALRLRGLSSSSSICLPDAASGRPRLSTMVDVELLIQRIGVDVRRQMEQIGILLGQATYILRMMMPELAANPLVVRLLVEEEERVQALWGEDTDAVLADMFAGSAARGFCAAARSYLAGQWYSQALAAYNRAIACDECCEEAREKIAEIEAMPGNKETHCRPMHVHRGIANPGKQG